VGHTLPLLILKGFLTITQTQQSLYESALDRADHQGVTIRGQGFTHPTDNESSSRYPFWTVNSASDPNTLYMVVLRDGHLACTCKAGQNLHYCKHRAVVRQYLMSLLRRIEHTERAVALRALPARVRLDELLPHLIQYRAALETRLPAETKARIAVMALTERLETWQAELSAALDELSAAEITHLHATRALNEAKARAETAIRAASAADPGKRLTEHAIEIAVSLASDVLVCESDVLDAKAALLTAQNRVEGLRAQGRMLGWLVQLAAGQTANDQAA
jgi:hypothetical protein